jgi:hypothetical protein
MDPLKSARKLWRKNRSHHGKSDQQHPGATSLAG